MFDLTGRRALITGASGDIGAAIARALHGQGAAVAISGTRREALDALAAELGGNCHVETCNLADSADVEGLVPRVTEAFGDIDILVNNAGTNRDALLVRLSDEDWDQVIKINLEATFRLSRAVLMGMMRRRHGRIISITSVVGITGNPGQANYAASKAGIAGMTKAIALEVATRNVTVNCIAPGFIQTAMTDKLNQKQRDAVMVRVPAQRLGVPADIGAAAVYLASDEANYITGQTLQVNGGMAMV